MKYAMYTHFDRMLIRHGADNACAYAADHGFSYIEHIDDIHPGVVQSVNNTAEARELAKVMRKYGLKMACCSVFADVWSYADALEKLKLQAEIAVETGSPYLHHTCLPWLKKSDGLPSIDEGIARAIDICGEVTLYAKRLGVTTLYEEQGLYLNGCEQFGRFISEMRKIDSNVGVCGDMGNIMFAEEDPLPFFEKYASLIKHVHVKAYSKFANIGEPGRLCYLLHSGKWLQEVSPAAESETVTSIVRILTKAGYKGVYSFELSDMDEYETNIKNTMELIKTAAESCER